MAKNETLFFNDKSFFLVKKIALRFFSIFLLRLVRLTCEKLFGFLKVKRIWDFGRSKVPWHGWTILNVFICSLSRTFTKFALAKLTFTVPHFFCTVVIALENCRMFANPFAHQVWYKIFIPADILTISSFSKPERSLKSFDSVFTGTKNIHKHTYTNVHKVYARSSVRISWPPFLNTQIRVSNGQYSVKCYRKGSSKIIVIHAKSVDPSAVKRPVLRSMFRTATKVSAGDEERKENSVC